MLKRGLQRRDRVLKFSLGQFQTAQIDQHSGRIAAVRDCSFEKSALIFPVECPDKRARAKKRDPERDRCERDCLPAVALAEVGRSLRSQFLGNCDCFKCDRQKKERAGQINPMLRDGCIQSDDPAHR